MIITSKENGINMWINKLDTFYTSCFNCKFPSYDEAEDFFKTCRTDVINAILRGYPEYHEYIKELTRPMIFSLLKSKKCEDFIHLADDDLLLEALEANYRIIKFIENPTIEQCKAAIKHSVCAFHYIKNPVDEIRYYSLSSEHYNFNKTEDCYLMYHPIIDMKQTEELCIYAVSQAPYALQYVKNKTDDIIRVALEQNGTFIKYIENKDAWIEKAIETNPNAVKFTKDPELIYRAIKMGACPALVDNISNELKWLSLEYDLSNYQFIKNPTFEMTQAALKKISNLYYAPKKHLSLENYLDYIKAGCLKHMDYIPLEISNDVLEALVDLEIDKKIILTKEQFMQAPDEIILKLFSKNYLELYNLKSCMIDRIDLVNSLIDIDVNVVKEICNQASIKHHSFVQPSICIDNRATELVSKSGFLIIFCSEQTLELCQIAVEQCPHSIRYCKIITSDIAEMAVRQDSMLIKYIPKHLITPELIKIAINQNPWAIKYLPGVKGPKHIERIIEQGEATLEDVKQDPWAVIYLPYDLITPDMLVDDNMIPYFPTNLLSTMNIDTTRHLIYQ